MLKTQWYQQRRTRGTRRQRGAALVEAGLIFPLLMFLVFGIIEVGSLLSTYSAAANSVRAGGRMASVQGNDATADQMTLARLAQEATAIRNGEIQFVIIWKAAGPESTIPAGCLAVAEGLGSANTSSQGVSGSCNVYARPQAAGGAFQMASGELSNPPEFYFGCGGSSESSQRLDCNWRPQTRETRISPRVLPTGSTRINPDYVGVFMRVEYRYLTGLLGATRTIDDNSITLLEPSNFGVGS